MVIITSKKMVTTVIVISITNVIMIIFTIVTGIINDHFDNVDYDCGYDLIRMLILII